jgi:hypothetical protein
MANRDSLIAKIRALMDKTVDNGCTEAEMSAALDKARAMIDAYEVSDEELRLTKEEKAVLRSEPPGTKDPHSIKFQLAYAIGKFTDTECWRNHRTKGGGLNFLGLKSDCDFATWLLDSLTAFVQGEIADYLMKEGRFYFGNSRRSAISSFVAGCTGRISERMLELVQQSKTNMHPTGRELVVVKNQLVSAAKAKLGLKLRSSSSTRTVGDRNAYAAGRSAGDSASFGRPVGGQNGTLRLGAR